MLPVITPLLDGDKGMAQAYADTWFEGSPEDVEDVENLLSGAGLTMDAAMAETLATNLDDFERIDDRLHYAEKRRAAAWRDLHRHREALAAQAQKAVERIEEAEFKTIADPDPERLKRHVIRL
jgi:hypothetical protein